MNSKRFATEEIDLRVRKEKFSWEVRVGAPTRKNKTNHDKFELVKRMTQKRSALGKCKINRRVAR